MTENNNIQVFSEEELSLTSEINTDTLEQDTLNSDSVSLDDNVIAPEEELKPKPGALYFIIVMFFLNMFNFMDRFIPSSTKELLKEEFQINDAETGIFVLAFLLVYMSTGPIFSTMVDRGVSRKLIIGGGLLAWSISASSAFFATGTYTFAASRAAVGIGESAFIACIPSFVSDFYPPKMRNKVLAFYYVSMPVGAAIGFILGGVLGSSLGWRYAYLLTGLPGVLLLIFVFFIKDPGLGVFEPRIEPEPWLVALKLLVKNQVYMYNTIGITLATFGVGGMADWLPTFFSRVIPSFSLSNASFAMGVVTVIGGILGAILGGVLADHLKTKTRQAYLLTSSLGLFLAAIFSVLGILLPKIFYLTVVLITLAEIFLFFYTGPVNADTVNCVTATMRSRAASLQIFMLHAFGDAISPLVVGAISDALLSPTCDSACSLSFAVLIIPLSFVLSSLVFFMGWGFASNPVEKIGTKKEKEGLLEE